MAHAEPDAQQKHVDTIRSLSEEFNEPIAILVDLSGPKIRLGDIPGGQIFCDLGQEFYLIDGREPQSPNELTSTYPPLVEELQVGDRMMLADGTVCMEVVAKKPGRVQLRVMEEPPAPTAAAPATPSVTSVPISVNHGQKTSPPKVFIHQPLSAGMFGGQ